MEFRIVGKSLITGQTLNTTIDVRDEAAARAHAESMGLQHISITSDEEADPAPPRRRRILTAAIIWSLASLAAAAAIAALLWTDRSATADFRRYLPDNPASALCIDFDRIRDTDAFREIEPTLRRSVPLWSGLTLTPADIAQAFAAADETGEYWILRTRVDMPLEDIVRQKRQHLRCDGQLAIKADGASGTVLVVRLAPKTFCMFEGADKSLEPRFTALAARFDRHAEHKLDAAVSRAMDHVAGADVVLLANPARQRANRPKLIALGVNIQRVIDVKTVLVFADERSAAAYLGGFDTQKKAAAENADASVESVLLSGLQMTQTGAEIRSTGRWSYEQIRRLTDNKPDRFIGALERAWK